MTDRNQYKPDTVACPGETLAEIMDERGWTVAQLSARSAISGWPLREILDARGRITDYYAERIAYATDTKPSFWINLERSYRDSLKETS